MYYVSEASDKIVTDELFTENESLTFERNEINN